MPLATAVQLLEIEAICGDLEGILEGGARLAVSNSGDSEETPSSPESPARPLSDGPHSYRLGRLAALARRLLRVRRDTWPKRPGKASRSNRSLARR